MIRRMIGAALFNAATYEDVENDENATTQAFVVVMIGAISQGIGLFLSSLLFVSAGSALGWLIRGIILAPVTWIVSSVVVYFVGSTLFRTPQTSVTIGQVLRTLGFAQSPRALGILLFVPILNILIGLILGIWVIITTVIAIRQAFDFDTLRAIGTGIVAVIVMIILGAIFRSIFGGPFVF